MNNWVQSRSPWDELWVPRGLGAASWWPLVAADHPAKGPPVALPVE